MAGESSQWRRPFLHPNMKMSSPDEFIQALRGARIEGGGVDEEGLHVFLDDGRVLVILGIVYVGTINHETLQ